MGGLRHGLSWLLLVMLGAIVAGAAALGIAQAPTSAALTDAVPNTLNASSYNEVATEATPQGSETAYLTWQAPNRLGGFVVSGSRRTYYVFIGQVEYVSLSVPAGSSTKHLTFYRQPTAGAAQEDPARTYLALASKGTDVQQSGTTTTMILSQGGQTVNLSYTVSGQYVAAFKGTGQGATVKVTISQVGGAAPVKLPAGAKVVGSPSASGG